MMMKLVRVVLAVTIIATGQTMQTTTGNFDSASRAFSPIPTTAYDAKARRINNTAL